MPLKSDRPCLDPLGICSTSLLRESYMLSTRVSNIRDVSII